MFSTKTTRDCQNFQVLRVTKKNWLKFSKRTEKNWSTIRKMSSIAWKIQLNILMRKRKNLKEFTSTSRVKFFTLKINQLDRKVNCIRSRARCRQSLDWREPGWWGSSWSSGCNRGVCSWCWILFHSVQHPRHQGGAQQVGYWEDHHHPGLLQEFWKEWRGSCCGPQVNKICLHRF